MNADEIKSTLRACGVVGAGGAGFPSYGKLSGGADTLILNCAECEPLLTLHRRLLADKATEIISALSEIGKALGVARCVIGIKAAYKATLEAITPVVRQFDNVEIKTLREVYPAGDEIVLIYQVTGKAVAPGGNFVLREGDRIYVTAFTNTLTILLKNLGIVTHKVKRVMLCGGGRVSYYLAKQLQNSGIQVQIVEQNPGRCRQMATMLPSACIIQGDSSSQFLLESEGISGCDALATLTGMDELNMIISLYGIRCGVPQVITKLGHIENTDLLGNLSLGSVISPKELCCNTIVQYVRAMKNQTGAALTVHTIADGQAEAMEFHADEGTRNCGKPLKTLKLKKGVLVVCISKGAKMEIPNGDSYFNVGDIVYVVTGRERTIYQLNDIFE